MKDRLIMLAVIVAVLGGVTAFNIYVRTPAQTEEQTKAQEEAEQKLEEGRVLAEELEAEAPDEHAGHDHAGHDHAAAPPPSGTYVPVYNEGWPEKMPDLYRLKFVTSKGEFVVEVDKNWAPVGAERLYDLARQNYFNEVHFYRVVPGFMAQFGISGNPAANAYFQNKNIPDEPVTLSNTRGMVTFARGGPNTRGTQLFINYNDRNTYLDNYQGGGFPPIGKVVEGMEVVDKLNGQYGDVLASDAMPRFSNTEASTRGNAYLDANYPGLDYIERVELIEPAPEGAESPKED